MQATPRRFPLATILAAGRTDRASAAEHGAWPDLPSSGGSRLGPVFPRPLTPARRRQRGAAPFQTVIDKAAVDAQVEQLDVIEGVMRNPTGPFSVFRHDDLGAVEKRGNVTVSGHVDYRNWTLNRLGTGDEFRVITESPGDVMSTLAWSRNHAIAAMAPADFDEALGDAGEEALTPIARAVGALDEIIRKYRERTARRALATA